MTLADRLLLAASLVGLVLLHDRGSCPTVMSWATAGAESEGAAASDQSEHPSSPWESP